MKWFLQNFFYLVHNVKQRGSKPDTSDMALVVTFSYLPGTYSSCLMAACPVEEKAMIIQFYIFAMSPSVSLSRRGTSKIERQLTSLSKVTRNIFKLVFMQSTLFFNLIFYYIIIHMLMV